MICVDVDEEKIAVLRAGKEPDLRAGARGAAAQEHRARSGSSFATDLAAAVRASEVVFIAVGTPQGDDGDADLRAAMAVAQQIAAAAQRYTVVVNKSTVPVGTAARMQAEIAARTQVEIDVVSNPEFLKEGAAIDDFLRPDRIVIGTDSASARGRSWRELYGPFVRTESPIYFMDPRSAELTKYAANAMLATRISFMNDMATLCERVGADVDCVRKAMGSDERIGQKFLFPGCGYGGSCFPKDVKALIATARDHGLDFTLLARRGRASTTARSGCSRRGRGRTSERATCAGKKFAVWGLAFKPKTDDMRQAPALVLIEELLAEGARGHGARSGGHRARPPPARRPRAVRAEPRTSRRRAPTRCSWSRSGTSSASRTSPG